MRRTLLAAALLALLIVLVALWSLVTGSAGLTVGEAMRALFAPGEGRSDVILWQVRLPRVVAAVAAGAALGAAGAIMQAVTGNPLAEPGLMGVNAGAAFAVVLALSVFGVTASGALTWCAFGGAGATAVLVYAMASAGRGGPTPIRLVLAGVIVGTFLGALTTAILLIDSQTLDAVRFWTAGSLKGRQLAQILPVLPYVAASLVAALVFARQFTTLGLGGDVARSIGQNPALWRAIAAGCVVGLAGSAVSIAGPLGLVGLVVPHMVRLTLGGGYGRIVPLSILGAAALTLLADTAPRALLGVDLPAGITLALIGAPFFICLARSHGAVRG
ncbi:iron ABC transporter permease [Oceanicola sp. 502str15]|uniref:FecCD family ABC transporter permease n=1 Tax=Oceanicola sp. 502str15 TaxID=2696061 RepID=UPI0020942F54|nr:iron ABC transporter permease [Oceanicola sp. 502str15]MCO6384130.1 iron chelate uptake ABC transporter family permease subunit [Oceanicola sp. 502str15]